MSFRKYQVVLTTGLDKMSDLNANKGLRSSMHKCGALS